MQAGLADYTRGEPLPWAEVVIARGRALAKVLAGERGDAARKAVDAAMRRAQEMKFLALLPALPGALVTV